MSELSCITATLESISQKMDKPDFISPRDIYKCLWMCRDFELTHLWQRSVFLGGFLLACFASYGGLVVAVLGRGNLGLDGRWIANGAAFGICFVGTVLSLLWIMMAKGSKAWYERYERAISAFGKAYPSGFSEGMDKLNGMDWEKIPGYVGPTLSDSLLNTKGGAYSPSKLNAAIGFVSLGVWIVLAFVHLAIATVGCKNLHGLKFLRTMVSDPPTMGFVFAMGLLVFWVFARANLKSGFFKNRG